MMRGSRVVHRPWAALALALSLSAAALVSAQPYSGESQVPCPANSTFTALSPAPACICDSGFTGNITWNAESNSWSGSCTVDYAAVCGNLAINRYSVDAATGNVTCYCDQANEIKRILAGISNIETSGSTISQIMASGRNSFPLIVDSGNRIVSGAAFMGAGRVVTVGHEGLIQNTQPGWKQFLLNIVAWASEGSQNKTRRIAFESSMSSTVSMVTAVGYTTVVRSGASNLSDVDVFITTNYAVYTDAQIQKIHAFVRNGGGLITGGHAWYWAYSNDASTVFDAFPGNKLIGASGLAVLTSTTDNSWNLVTKPATELAQSTCALDLFRRQAAGQVTMTTEQVGSASVGVSAMSGSVPINHPLFADIRSFSDSVGPVVPKSNKPVVQSAEPARALAAKIQVRIALDSPPESTVAHPAGSDFPGAVPADTPRVTKTITIDGNDNGHPMDYNGMSGGAWRSTGLYAPPGELISFTVDPALANKGLMVRIGCHSDSLYHLDAWYRMPELTRSKSLTTATLKMANGFGGPIYVGVLAGKNLGPVPVTVTGAVEMGYHKHGRDGDAELAAMKQLKAPWFEFESNGFVGTLPASEFASLTTMSYVHDYWSTALPQYGALGGYDSSKYRAQWMVLDRQISAGYMHSGYPWMGPVSASQGTLPKGKPYGGNWGHFHEMGHNLVWKDWMLPGMGECGNNIYSVYVSEKVANLTKAQAHPALSPSSRAQRLREWQANPDPATWNTWVCLDVYMELQEKFGWQLLEKVMGGQRNRPLAQRPADNDNARIQQWVLDTSNASATNLVPFYRARWGFKIDPATEAAVSGLAQWVDHPLANITCGLANVTCTPDQAQLTDTNCTVGINCTTTVCCVPFCSLPSNNGKACDDHNVTSVEDKCSQGVCAGVPATCANQQATFAECPTGYVVADTKFCTPGTSCTKSNCCVPALCGTANLTACPSATDFTFLADAPCVYGQNCTVAACCEHFCAVPSNDGNTCNDFNETTFGDRCTGGKCVGTPGTCSNQASTFGGCTGDYVLLETKSCVPNVTCNVQACCTHFCTFASNNGKTCDDGNALTTDDACSASKCAGLQTAAVLKGVPSGKCLNAPLPGANVRPSIRSCNQVENQLWGYTRAGELVVFNGTYGTWCLTSGTTNGSSATLAACTGATAQKWTLLADTRISNDQTGFCLDVAGAATGEGSGISVYTCDAARNSQKWTREAGTLDRTFSPANSTLFKGTASGKCLNAPSAATNTRVNIFTCDFAKANQTWQYTAARELRVYDNMCLTSTGSNSPMVITPCSGVHKQKWTLWSTNMLTNDDTAMCLDVYGGATADGSPLYSWSCAGSSNQKWEPQGTCANQRTTCPAGFLLTGEKVCTPGQSCSPSNCCIPGVCGTANVSACPSADFTFQETAPCVYGQNCTVAACCQHFCALPSNDGNTCNDYNATTIGDKCTGGKCVGTPNTCADVAATIGTCPTDFLLQETKVCTPNVNCSVGTCCAHFCTWAANEGKECSDGNANTVNDTCSAGRCAGVQLATPLMGVASGRCLNAPMPTAGTQATIRSCNQIENQQWEYTKNAELVAFSGTRCLTSGSTSGSAATIAVCTGAQNQKWTLLADQTIANAQTGLCLDVAGAATGESSAITVTTCSATSTSQKWTRSLPSNALVPTLPSGLEAANFKGLQSAKCLNAPSSAANTQVTILACNHTSANQMWEYSSARELKVFGNMCLTSAMSYGQPLLITPCSGAYTQKWTIWNDTTINNDQTGLCIDPRGGATADNSVVQSYTCVGINNMRFARENPAPRPATMLSNVAASSGGTARCMNATSGATAGPVRSVKCDNASAGQWWTYTAARELKVLSESASPMCLTAGASRSTLATVAACNGDVLQKWAMWNDTTLQSYADHALCLVVQNGNTGEGGYFDMYYCDNGAYTKWTLRSS